MTSSNIFDNDTLIKFSEYTKRSDTSHIKEALEIIDNCFKLFNFNLDKLCISFNGGKDCTVLIFLIRAYLFQNCFLDKKKKLGKIKTIYFKPSDEFQEIDEFIKFSINYFFLDLIIYNSNSIKSSLNEFKFSNQGCNIKAIFMGQRSSDENSSIKPIQRTDKDWPDFLLINPLLNWSYHQIWSFILEYNVPYCSLYEKGFSSIGSKKNTIPNLKLSVKLEDGKIIYLPAYKLHDSKYERFNRK